MRQIVKIFKDDINSLVKNFFALVIVIGICFLPALYAWFNIYSNWDPYGSTGALKIAAISVDKGYTDDEGVYHNQGEAVIKNLHKNKAVNWQFVKTKKQAVDGVNSGEYYAAVVVQEDFSENMYNVLSDKNSKPSLLFYENQKKNPVATKISDTVVSSLQTKINESFVEVVMSTLFADTSKVYKNATSDGGVDDILKKLDSVTVKIDSYEKSIDTLIAKNNSLKAKIEDTKNSLTSSKEKATTKSNELQSKANSPEVKAKLNSLQKQAQDAAKELDSATSDLNELKKELNEKATPEIENTIKNLQALITEEKKLVDSLNSSIDSTIQTLNQAEKTIDSVNSSLSKSKKAIDKVNQRLKKSLESAWKVRNEKKLEELINTLSGDSKRFGSFFSKPVNVKTKEVYKVSNYGSAVAPFYTTLAFWVGALILTAIIKVKPDKKKYPDFKPHEFYFGRYVLYWILGQVQAIVIVLGDLFLLKVQCLHPWFFLLAALTTASVFTLLIYSLVVTWGDVGKAISVVVVVIQIAGSSGTYPIELLPEFFKKVYIFFPFPYAINAIRETLCGMYEVDYWIYLLKLLIFAVVALFIGLIIRIPFEEINHYMEERMEDTEMM